MESKLVSRTLYACLSQGSDGGVVFVGNNAKHTMYAVREGEQVTLCHDEWFVISLIGLSPYTTLALATFWNDIVPQRADPWLTVREVLDYLSASEASRVVYTVRIGDEYFNLKATQVA